MLTEQKIQTSIIKYLESKHWIVFKLMSVSKAGVPDLICHQSGFTFYIEVKKPGGRLSKIQQYRISKLKEQNIDVLITDNLEVVKEYERTIQRFSNKDFN